jgi:hypothetical protein
MQGVIRRLIVVGVLSASISGVAALPAGADEGLSDTASYDLAVHNAAVEFGAAVVVYAAHKPNMNAVSEASEVFAEATSEFWGQVASLEAPPSDQFEQQRLLINVSALGAGLQLTNADAEAFDRAAVVGDQARTLSLLKRIKVLVLANEA